MFIYPIEAMFLKFNFGNKSNRSFSKFCLTILTLSLVLLFGCDRPLDTTQSDTGVPPAVPVGLEVVYAADGTIVLDWKNNSEPTLGGYNIYRSTDSVNFSLIGFTSNNYFVNDSLSYDTTYYYRITALDIWNNESKPSKVVFAQPLNYYAPSQPQGLTINARNWDGKLSVYLSWYSNSETDIKGYYIYKSLAESFTPGDSNRIGFTTGISFSDTVNLKLYTMYYYQIKAVDKGGLLSTPSQEVNDQIYGVPQIIFPKDNLETSYFTSFIIKAIAVPAQYKIVVQDNQFFGDFWSTSFSSSVVNDTISVNFNPLYINSNTPYYWRVYTYSQNNNNPNSVTPLYKFTIKQ